MANQPHPDRKAVTWRLHRDLVAAVQAHAASDGETVLAFVTRALERELATMASSGPSDRPGLTNGARPVGAEGFDAPRCAQAI